jgi:uncharacterized protein YqgV (UPF0045/DUF77 family)
MDKNQIRKDIESLIDNIKEHFDNALDHDHIPQLELETIVNKIEKLHQKAIIFHYLNEKHHEVDRTHKNIEPVADTSSTEPQQTDLFGSAIAPKQPAQTITKSTSQAEKKTESISDINTAIGINEKFQFINELFEGNMNEYTAAINQLNNYTSFSEAEAYLNSVKGIYKWNDDQPMVEKFMSIVKRKLK